MRESGVLQREEKQPHSTMGVGMGGTRSDGESLDCVLFCFLSSPEFTLAGFKERGREGQRDRNIDVRGKHPVVAFCTRPTGDQTCNLDMCRDWESNPRSFGLQMDAPIN